MTTPPPPLTAAILTAAEMQAIQRDVTEVFWSRSPAASKLAQNRCLNSVQRLLATAEHYAGQVGWYDDALEKATGYLTSIGAALGVKFPDPENGYTMGEDVVEAAKRCAPAAPPAETRTEEKSTSSEYERAIADLDEVRRGRGYLSYVRAGSVIEAVQSHVAAERARADAAEKELEAAEQHVKILRGQVDSLGNVCGFNVTGKPWDVAVRETVLGLRESLVDQQNRADAAEKGRDDRKATAELFAGAALSLAQERNAARETVRGLREVLEPFVAGKETDLELMHPDNKTKSTQVHRFWSELVHAARAALASPPAAPAAKQPTRLCRNCGVNPAESGVTLCEHCWPPDPPDLTLRSILPSVLAQQPAGGPSELVEAGNALADTLDALRPLPKVIDPIVVGRICRWQDAVLALAQQHAGATAGWISVRDRLPEPTVRVLVCSKMVGCHDHIDVATIEDEAWCNFNWHRDVPVDEPGITHWMPLPAPPASSPAAPDTEAR